MSKIKAVIYDVDGTMVNSEPLHVAAWDQALREYGFELLNLSESFRETMAGKKPIVIAQEMVEELTLPTVTENFLALKSSFFLEKAREHLEGMPGVVESVHRFKDAGYKLAIGTSLDKDYLDLILNRLNLAGLFDAIVTGDQIKNGKPHPETYVTVFERLELEPTECVVLEDAQTGIQSAKAAGALCTAIINNDAVTQRTEEADIVVSSLNEVTLELIGHF